jgi:hypothetical protein
MSERKPFEHKLAAPGREALGGNGSLKCEEWELMLTEALDGLLAGSDRKAFDTHAGECTVCAQLLGEAKRGQEWLQFLEAEPEAPPDLVERIVSKTSGMAAGGPLAVAAAAGVASGAAPVHVLGLPVRRIVWDTRMMMTVAMAFFSIALTLNLAGVKLTNLRLADLTPASMETNLTRQFYGAKSSLVRYYDNLRLVYEVESKMHDLRKAEQMQQTQPEQQKQEQQQKQEVPANPPGNGHKNGGKLEPATKIPQEGLLWGSPMLASAAGQGEDANKEVNKKDYEVVDFAGFFRRAQAERSLA